MYLQLWYVAVASLFFQHKSKHLIDSLAARTLQINKKHSEVSNLIYETLKNEPIKGTFW